MHDFAIVGGGIVGLSAGMALLRRCPGARLVVLEKEQSWARHQSGRNSGVIHSGIYYPPGSRKFAWARAGSRALVSFCNEHGIEHRVCGKLIVATERAELGPLKALYRRGLEHGLQVAELGPEEVREIEPHVRCLAAIRVPSAGVVSFRQVCSKLAETIGDGGGDLRTGAEVLRIDRAAGAHVLETSGGSLEARVVVNCAGLHSDRVARLAGVQPGVRILPFRGDYYDLEPRRRHLVEGLVYPVPDPRFPFLGVHFTRTVDGRVHAGPNAVLALRREGYHRWAVDLRDAAEILAYPGFWRLAARHAGEGVRELARSVSKRAFARSLRRLVPEVRAEDLLPALPGVRAQAVAPDGRLVDDFLVVESEGAVHVCNAPSPAATAALALGDAVAEIAARSYARRCGAAALRRIGASGERAPPRDRTETRGAGDVHRDSKGKVMT